MAYKPDLHANSAILDSLFYAYSAIVGSFHHSLLFFSRKITFHSIILD